MLLPKPGSAMGAAVERPSRPSTVAPARQRPGMEWIRVYMVDLAGTRNNPGGGGFT